MIFIAKMDSADNHATELMYFGAPYIAISTSQLAQAIIASEVGGSTEWL